MFHFSRTPVEAVKVYSTSVWVFLHKCICSLHSRYTPSIEVCLQCALRGTAGTLQFDLGKGYDTGGHANSQVFSYWRAIDEGESYDKDKITALHSWLEYSRY